MSCLVKKLTETQNDFEDEEEECPECGQMFGDLNQLSYHFKTDHELTGDDKSAGKNMEECDETNDQAHYDIVIEQYADGYHQERDEMIDDGNESEIQEGSGIDVYDDDNDLNSYHGKIDGNTEDDEYTAIEDNNFQTGVEDDNTDYYSEVDEEIFENTGENNDGEQSMHDNYDNFENDGKYNEQDTEYSDDEKSGNDHHEQTMDYYQRIEEYIENGGENDEPIVNDYDHNNDEDTSQIMDCESSDHTANYQYDDNEESIGNYEDMDDLNHFDGDGVNYDYIEDQYGEDNRLIEDGELINIAKNVDGFQDSYDNEDKNILDVEDEALTENDSGFIDNSNYDDDHNTHEYREDNLNMNDEYYIQTVDDHKYNNEIIQDKPIARETQDYSKDSYNQNSKTETQEKINPNSYIFTSTPARTNLIEPKKGLFRVDLNYLHLSEEVIKSFNTKTGRKRSLENSAMTLNSKKQKLDSSQASEKDLDESSLVFSNEWKDACKTLCQICKKLFGLTHLRNHTKQKHGISILNYKSIFGSPTISKKVYHKCGICAATVLLDSDIIYNHTKHHKISTKHYTERYMVKQHKSVHTEINNKLPGITALLDTDATDSSPVQNTIISPSSPVKTKYVQNLNISVQNLDISALTLPSPVKFDSSETSNVSPLKLNSNLSSPAKTSLEHNINDAIQQIQGNVDKLDSKNVGVKVEDLNIQDSSNNLNNSIESDSEDENYEPRTKMVVECPCQNCRSGYNKNKRPNDECHECLYPTCRRMFMRAKNLYKHLADRSEHPYLCPGNRCKKPFKKGDLFVKHISKTGHTKKSKAKARKQTKARKSLSKNNL